MILSDSGWNGKSEGRCYVVYHRTMVFGQGTNQAEVRAIAQALKDTHVGQEFSSELIPGKYPDEGPVLKIRAACDSSD